MIQRLHTINSDVNVLGRSETVKKYGFLPSKSHLRSSSSDSESSDSDDEHGSMYSLFSSYFIFLSSFPRLPEKKKNTFSVTFSFPSSEIEFRSDHRAFIRWVFCYFS